MDNKNTFFYKLFIELTVLTVTAVSIFSLFSLMNIGGWTASILSVLWATYRVIKAKPHVNISEIRENILVVLLFIMCGISAAVGAHSFLDSYSYRIPQLLFWLQEGHPWSIPYVDTRINQMPHVYSFIVLPFFQIFGEKGLAIPNLISFILIFVTLKHICTLAYGNSGKISWILLIFMSSPIIVMQAATNDNVLLCCAFLMISTVLLMEKTKYSIVYSAFAFALCCGIKPQYLTLAPIWVAGAFIKRSELTKYKAYILILLMPLLVLCSPVPTMGYNYLVNGSFMHPEIETKNEAIAGPSIQQSNKSKNSMMLVSATLVNQLFALPVNPMAGNLTSTLHKIISKHTYLQNKGLEAVKVYLIVIAEKASFGLLAMLAIIIGFILPKARNRRLTVICVGSVLCLIISLIATRPITAGRSFLGFFLLMIPLAIGGLMSLNTRKLQIYGIICFLAGIITIIVNPARPLWPAKFVASKVNHSKLSQQINQYCLYSERHNVGKLTTKIPHEENRIGVIMLDAPPFARLWHKSKNWKLIPMSTNNVLAEAAKQDINYIVIYQGSHSTKIIDNIFDGNYIITDTINHVSYMSKGYEDWTVIKTDE